jgi:hypothetical protein
MRHRTYLTGDRVRSRVPIGARGGGPAGVVYEVMGTEGMEGTERFFDGPYLRLGQRDNMGDLIEVARLRVDANLRRRVELVPASKPPGPVFDRLFNSILGWQKSRSERWQTRDALEGRR